MKHWRPNNAWQCAFFAALGLLLAQWHGSQAQRRDPEEAYEKLWQNRFDAKLQEEFENLDLDAPRIMAKRLDASRKYAAILQAEWEVGKTRSSNDLGEAYRRLVNAELAVARNAKERIDAVERNWLALRKVELAAQARYDDVRNSPKEADPWRRIEQEQDLHAQFLERKCDRLEAELLLARLKKEEPAKP